MNQTPIPGRLYTVCPHGELKFEPGDLVCNENLDLISDPVCIPRGTVVMCVLHNNATKKFSIGTNPASVVLYDEKLVLIFDARLKPVVVPQQ